MDFSPAISLHSKKKADITFTLSPGLKSFLIRGNVASGGIITSPEMMFCSTKVTLPSQRSLWLEQPVLPCLPLPTAEVPSLLNIESNIIVAFAITEITQRHECEITRPQAKET